MGRLRALNYLLHTKKNLPCLSGFNVRQLSYMPAIERKPSFQPSSMPVIRRNLDEGHSFGLVFDIDGVILRGKHLLPQAASAFRKLVDKNGKFRVPVVFVTNAGNCLRQSKADTLSKLLNIEVDTEQVIMSHSPLRMFTPFHDKKCLICGQGPIEEIAKYLGFKQTVTIDQVRDTFPWLDRVEVNKNNVHINSSCGQKLARYFKPIEAVLMFGEPSSWETSLQLLLDVLVTQGHPGTVPTAIPYPHVPVIACNMDLLWMAEAGIPRLAHGSFLLCLEALYNKITGRDLQYTALIGKPSELTYFHAETIIGQEAAKLGWKEPIKRLYCVGDNKDTDICGGNLYNRYLKLQQQSFTNQQPQLPQGRDIPEGWSGSDLAPLCAETMESILVCTGVHQNGNATTVAKQQQLDTEERRGLYHGHRDFAIDADFREPNHEVSTVLEAVELVLEREAFQ